MRALVLSDSHGEESTLRWMLEQAWKTVGPVDAYIHCGDGAADFARLENFIRARDEHAAMVGVRGNCDFMAHDLTDVKILGLGGANILVTHGHLYGVKSSFARLDDAAKEHGCSIALFGHTHKPCVEPRWALLVNPGSAADGRMALLEINDGKPCVQLLCF